MDTGSVLLLIHCLLLLLLFVGFCVWSLFCNAVLNVISGFAINMLRKRERFAFLCVLTAMLVLVLWVRLQYVVEAFPAWADPEGGRQGVQTPLKYHKNIRFLGNTGRVPLENHKATQPAFNVGQ